MEIVRDGEAVKSPFLNEDVGRAPDLEAIGERVKDEFEGAIRGVENFNSVDPSIFDPYSFQSAIDSEQENVWNNNVSVLVEDNYPHVNDWAREVVSELEESDRFVVNCLDDFSYDFGTREAVAEQADYVVRVSEREEIEDEAVLELEDNVLSRGPEVIRGILEEQQFDNELQDSGSSYGTTISFDGKDAIITPDLLTGWFDVESGFDSSYSAKIWVPYADREQALVIGRDGEEVGSHVVTNDSARTGDFFMDAADQAVDHYLPFWGVLQPEISSEAVDFFNDRDYQGASRDIEIRQKAWNQLEEDRYSTKNIRNELYKKACRENPGGTYTRATNDGESGEVDQLDREENYIRWNLNKGRDTIILEQLYNSRSDAVPSDDRT